MSSFSMTRRKFLGTSAAFSAGLGSGMWSVGVGAQGERVLNVRLVRDIQILDPGYMIGSGETVTQFAVLPRLAQVPSGTEWTWVPSAFVNHIGHRDPNHIDFELKPGLMWSDGFGELTTADVKFSYERMKESEWSGKWEALDHVEIQDAYRGTLVLSRPFAPLWLTALARSTNAIVCKAAFEAKGITQFTTDLPAQLGPYRLTEWRPKEHLILERNPDWPLEKPWFDVINYIVVEDTNSAELAYEAGEVDLTEVTALSYRRYVEDPPAETTFNARNYLTYTWLGMNTEHPSLSDIRVRKAIQHAVDVDSILEAAYGGAAPKAYGIVPPGLVGKRDETKYHYDPAKASELLQAAGVTDLSLTLQTLNVQDRVTSAQIIQANLADIGITVEVIPLDSGPFWNLGQESKGDAWKDLQLWIMRYGGSPDPFDHFQWFVRDQVGIWNWERWSDDEFEELYAQGLAEPDQGVRDGIYLRMGEIMEDTGAYVWLVHEQVFYMHRNWLQGGLDPAGQMDFTQMSGTA